MEMSEVIEALEGCASIVRGKAEDGDSELFAVSVALGACIDALEAVDETEG